MIIEITQDQAAMLPPGDFEKLDKRQREAFHAMQERMTQYLIRESNDFKLQHAGLHVDFRFQVEIYSSPEQKPSTIRYSSRVY